jgi:hypothetical protein
LFTGQKEGKEEEEEGEGEKKPQDNVLFFFEEYPRSFTACRFFCLIQ